MLEQVARLQDQADIGTPFTLGLLSGIEPLLQVPLAQALAPLRLPDDSRSALLQRQGALAPGLDLLDAMDAGDAPATLQALQALGLPQLDLAAVSQLQDEAWAWAAEVSRAS